LESITYINFKGHPRSLEMTQFILMFTIS